MAKFLDAAGVEALWANVKAGDTAAIAAAIAGAGKVATGSYTGTNKSGKSYPTSLTLDFEPKAVFVFGTNGSKYQIGIFGTVMGAGSNQHEAPNYDVTLSTCISSVSGNTISWYGGSAARQMNASGYTYHWVAIG